VTVMGEKSTHVRSIQGWEDRIATMIPFFSMTGKLISPLVLIFKGKGKKVAADELAEYKRLKNILVLWQAKAWIDKTLEKEVMKHQVVPEVNARKKEYEDRGEVFPGFLLLQDRGPGHDHQYASHLTNPLILNRDVLEICKKASVEMVLTPSDTTWAIQLVDDGRGKSLRNMIFDEFDKYLEDFDWATNPKGVLSAKAKRLLTAQYADLAFQNFSSSEQQTTNTIKAAYRTGGRMEVSANYDKIQPVRFPSDFGLSILPGHPLSTFAKKYIPVGTLATSHPSSTPPLDTISVSTIVVVSSGAPTSTITTTTAITNASSSTHSVLSGGTTVLLDRDRTLISGGAVAVSHSSFFSPTAAGGTISLGPQSITATGGSATAPLSVPPLPAPPHQPTSSPATSVGRVEMTDGYESEEQPRIFLEEEVDSSEEASSSSSSGEEGIVRRARTRVRGCLAGCDCERRGRRCNCEKTSGTCGDYCGCDKAKCRTFAAASESDDPFDT
jgi:hypothetical protein